MNPVLCWLPPFLARPMKSCAFTIGTMNGCREDCFNVKDTGVRPYKGSTYMLHRRYFTGQSEKEFIGNKADTNYIESDCCRASSVISSDYRRAKEQHVLMKAVYCTKTWWWWGASLKASTVRLQFRKTIFELLASTHTWANRK